jgi:phosphatidylserine decarboxylase
MSMPVKEWKAEAEKEAKGMDRNTLDHVFFPRDPCRPMFTDPDLIFTPADGTIIYQKAVSGNSGKVLNVKGSSFTLGELIGDKDYDVPCMVIGIFMSAWDVHINRMPTGGTVRYRLLDPLVTRNVPMLETEKDIFKGMVGKNTVDYMKVNERMWNRVYCPDLDYEYFMIQTADDDVDIIQPFSVDQSRYYEQNERFSYVRWGSQVDLILPKTDKFKIQLLQKEMYHVKGCEDPLVKVIR